MLKPEHSIKPSICSSLGPNAWDPIAAATRCCCSCQNLQAAWLYVMGSGVDKYRLPLSLAIFMLVSAPCLHPSVRTSSLSSPAFAVGWSG